MTEGSRALALAFVFFATLPATTSAALFCTCPAQNTSILARLVGGNEEGMGRVELLYNGEWGTVCNRGLWTQPEADVICRQLGYTAGSLGGTAGAFFGAGQGDILLDIVNCRGHEANIADCNYTALNWGKVSSVCRHTWDAGVICKVSPEDKVEVRLSDGSNPAQGRLEVGLRGMWGYVCDTLWDSKDADVVCRQLGYRRALVSISGQRWGKRLAGFIFTGNVRCHGGETNIDDCQHGNWGYGGSGCSYSRIVNVVCDDEYNQEMVRLEGGGSPASGRVSIGFNNSWATICDKTWDKKDADVVCRKLGYNESLVATVSSSFGAGESWIWTDTTNCLGEEKALSECPGRLWGYVDGRYCGTHQHDAGVVCKTSADQDIEIRLVGGPSSSQGRVEIGLGGAWGTICDAQWDLHDATVICRHLGFNRALVAAKGGVFGAGDGRIWTQNVRCTGSERSLLDCTVDGWGNVSSNICNHGNDAGVICGDADNSVQVRLSGTNSGRVEIGFNGNWGTLCSRGWDRKDAAVICRQLGYQKAFAALARSSPGSGRIWTFGVDCHGSEDNIIDCATPNGWGNPGKCTHLEDAGVVCGNDNSAVDVRLVGGNGTFGTVEVGFEGVWGTICHNKWDKKEAEVICRMLGYPNGLATNFSTFGSGSGRIWLSDLNCDGEEQSIADCVVDPWGVEESCDHSMDAGVICLRPETKLDVRLVGGSDGSQGRVEIGFYGAWGRVCDDYWDIQEARVVCLMLGYPYAIAAIGPSTFGDGHGRVWVDNVWCKGEESTLLDCPLQGWSVQSCKQGDYAGVICSNNPPKLDIRLVGGTDEYSGRVEVGMNGTWGTICDSGWDILDAQVVCREMGYTGAIAATRGASFGAGTGRIWTFIMGCKGEESSLMQCNKPGLRWGVIGSECSHYRDAGVVCMKSDGSSGIQARLMRSADESELEGRVLIGLNGAWGAICYAGWGIQDANVVCRHLGYTSAVSASYDNVGGSWPGRVWLQDLRCKGDERTLLNCSHGGWGYDTKCRGRNKYRLARVVCSDEPSLENRVKVSVSPSSIAIATGDQATIVCVFGGINVSDCTVTWRVNGTDITNTTSAGNFLMRTDGNSSFLIFKQCISALSGSYSCELSEYPSIQSPHVPVTIEQGCMAGLGGTGSQARIGDSFSVGCTSVHPALNPVGSVTWRCASDLSWEVDLSPCTLQQASRGDLMRAYLAVEKILEENEKEQVLDEVKSVLETQISGVTSFRGLFIDSGIHNTTGIIVSMRTSGVQWTELSWESFGGNFIRLSGAFVMVKVQDGLVFPSSDTCKCRIQYTSSDSREAPYLASLCRGIEGVNVTPCVCPSSNETGCTCSGLYTQLRSGWCSLDTDGDGVPNSRDDCEFCCPQENLHGFTWPRTSNGLRVTFPCSSLHSAFSEGSLVARHCSTSGKWRDVDYSGCTFKPNSNLIVGIVEVTVDMATGTFNGKNGIQNVLHRARRHLSGHNPSNFATVSILGNSQGNTVVTISVNFPLQTSASVLLELLPLTDGSEFVFSRVPLLYGFIPSGSCVCRRLPSLWLVSFVPLCTGTGLPPCYCLNSACECLDPYSHIVGSTQCSLDRDGDKTPDIEDEDSLEYNGYLEHTNCEVLQDVSCSASNTEGTTWPNTEPCSWAVKRCSSRGGNGASDIGVTRRLCNGRGMWEEPDVSSCERRDFWKIRTLVKLVAETAGTSSPLIGAGLKINLPADHVAKLNESMNMIISTLRGQNVKLYPKDVHTIVTHLKMMLRVYDVCNNTEWKTNVINSTLAAIDLLVEEKLSSSWKQQDKVSGDRMPHAVGVLLALLEKVTMSYKKDRLPVAPQDYGIESVTQVNALQNIVFNKYTVDPISYRHSALVFRGRDVSDTFAQQPVVRIPRDLLLERSREQNNTSVEVVVTQMTTSQLFASSSAVNLTKPVLGNGTLSTTRTASLVLSCQVGETANLQYSSLNKRPLEVFFPSATPGPVTSGDCVYWQAEDSGPGFWSDVGVDTIYGDDGILCRSRHLSSFTVLTDVVVEVPTPAPVTIRVLYSIRYASLFSAPISAIVVLATIIVIAATVRREVLDNQSYFIRVSLCVTLLLALLVIIGIYLAGLTGSEGGCVTVSAFLHYFTLSAFCWLLCEGIHVFRLTVIVLDPVNKKWFAYYGIVGWGVPLLIVAISLAARHELYKITVSREPNLVVCWLPFEEGVVAAFLGPVSVILLAILTVVCMALKRLFNFTHDANNKRVSTPEARETVQSGRNLLVGHIPAVLGTTLTWVIGSLAGNLLLTSPSVGWAFFAIMLFQGPVVFMAYVVMDSRVRRKILCCRRGPEEDGQANVLYTVEDSGTVKLPGVDKDQEDTGTHPAHVDADDSSSIHSGNLEVDNNKSFEDEHEEKKWMDVFPDSKPWVI